MGVTVEIGELVLHGVRPADRARVAAAFTRELTRLFAVSTPTASAPTASTDSLAAPLPPIAGSRTPRRLGTALARAVHSALVPPGMERP